MICIFFLSQSSPILELFPFDKITLKSYICTVVTVMAKQCWSQTVLESGSWGHSVLQTPALVFFCFFWGGVCVGGRGGGIASFPLSLSHGSSFFFFFMGSHALSDMAKSFQTVNQKIGRYVRESFKKLSEQHLIFLNRFPQRAMFGHRQSDSLHANIPTHHLNWF